MNCDRARERLSWFLDGEVSEVEWAEIDAHLSGCAECRAHRERLDGVDALLERARPYLTHEPQRRPAPPVDGRKIIVRRVVNVAAVATLGLMGWWGMVNLESPDTQEVFVTGGDTIAAGSEGLLRIFVRDGETALPIMGAAVTLVVAGRRREGVTDADGITVIPVAVPEDAEGTCDVQITVGGDRITHPINVARSSKVLLTTSKPLYQPMQLIEMRALAMNPLTMKPMADEVTLFEVEDPNGNKVFKKEMKTSAYGIASAVFHLADEITFGHYRVRATVKGAPTERLVEVKNYVLPKFKVDVTIEREFFAPGETVDGAFTARYFFGKPVEDGEVKVTLSTFIADGFKEIGSEKLRTDAEGHGTFSMKLPPKLYGVDLARGDALVKVEVEVIDGAEHRERGVRNVMVTHQPLKIHVIPEGGEIVAGVENRLYIATSYANGRPAVCRLEIGDRELETDKTGIAQIDGLGEKDSLAIRAFDGKGQTAQKNVRLVDFVSADQDFLVRTDKASYTAGETLDVTVLARGPPGAYYLDLLKNRQTIATHVIEVENGRGDLTLDLPPDSAGTLRLAVYHILPDGNFVRDVCTVVVGLPQGLVIRPKPLKEQYRPGEEIEVEFEILDADGKPLRAALGVSVVDEALFALVEESPGYEAIFFAIEEDVLQPRAQLKNATLTAPAATLLSPPSEAAGLARISNIAEQDFRPRLAEVRANPKKQAHLARMARINGTMRTAMIGIFSGILGTLCIVWLAGWTQRHMSAMTRLVEILCVFLILGVLVALLVPATAGSMREADSSPTARGIFFGLGDDEVLVPSKDPARWEAREDPRYDGNTVTYDNIFDLSSVKYDDTHPPRIRQFFPELLYWNPQLITDEYGRVKVTMPPADSITSWRLAASGVSLDGRIGAAQTGITVFQDFFIDIDMPVSLTQGDEISLPIAIHNYLKEPQSVELRAQPGDWFELIDRAVKRVELKPNEVTGVFYRIRVKKPGYHSFTVEARGTKLSDAVRRGVDVLPDGKEIPYGVSDRLTASCRHPFTVPDNAIDNAGGCWVRLFPSPVAEAVTGLEGLVRLPYG